MCGIFGIYGAPKKADHDKFLKDAMVCGSLRGTHGAGAMKVFVDAKDSATYCSAYKIASTGQEFVQDSRAAQMLITDNTTMAVVGHNRYAIGSAVNENNAHPFWRGAITLVHNGVIDNQYELLSGRSLSAHGAKPAVQVDSDSVALALSATDDPVSVLESVDGAYAFVWHDSRTSTLNFARNAERPMWLGHAGDVTVFASERGMLEWLAPRNNIHITEYQELPVGCLFSVRYDHKTKTLVGTTTNFKAAERKKWESAVVAGYRGASSPSYKNASYVPSKRSRDIMQNLDEDTYTDLVKYVQGKCAAEGVIMGQEHDWFLDSVTSSDERTVVMLKSTEVTSVQASKYLYLDNTRTTVEGRLTSIVDTKLRDTLLKFKDDYIVVSCPPKAVVITDPEWMTKTTETVYREGGWRFIVDSEKLVVSTLDGTTGTFKVLFSTVTATQDAYAELFKGRKQFDKDTLYQITNQTEASMRDTYKGNPLVRFSRHAQQAGMIVISPVNNPGVTILVPELNVVEAMQ